MAELLVARETHPLDAALASERPRLLRLCARLTGDAGAAEDLAQETLIEAWRQAHKLTDPRGVGPWLSAIARNVCLRWARQHGREMRHIAPAIAGEWERPDLALERMGEDAMDAADAVATDDFTLELERDELAALLDHALALLPAETRAVLLARYVEETPQAEVARRLGMSASAVAVRLHRGRLALRRALAVDLREEAGADGLAARAAGSAAWRETSMWCVMCGQRRLVGRFSAARAELLLRCPACDAEPGGVFCHHVSYAGLFDGVAGLKPAFSRVLRWGNSYYRRALADGAATCHHCGRAAPLRMGLPADHADAWRDPHAFHVACAPCRYPQNDASLDFLALSLPEGLRFWREHPRIRRLPKREVEADGRAALVVSFESVTDRARLEALVTAERFDILRVETRQGGVPAC